MQISVELLISNKINVWKMLNCVRNHKKFAVSLRNTHTHTHTHTHIYIYIMGRITLHPLFGTLYT